MLLTATVGLAQQPLPAPGHIELVCIDDQVIHGATFQSNNQKVVVNERGIFVAYIKSRNDEYTAQTWKLMHSTDGGQTFSALASGVGATNPPVLETDDQANIYLGRVDWLTGDAMIDRFLAADGYQQARTTVLPGGAAGKYAMALDRQRQALVFFSHQNEFYRVGLDGTLLARVTLTQAGPHAVLQYPSLSFDEHGDLFAAWTTVRPDKYLYHDIHVMQSKDGGQAWQTLAGQPLTLPIVADDTGPAQQVVLPEELDITTWLCNGLARHGKWHAMYQAQFKPARFHYVRFDLATGQEDLRLTPEFKGQTLSLNGLDGSFSSQAADARAAIVAVSKDALLPRLAALISHDAGQTWNDLAASDVVVAPYAISGCRELAPDGHAIGVFTDAIEPSNAPQGKSKVYFYKVRVR